MSGGNYPCGACSGNFIHLTGELGAKELSQQIWESTRISGGMKKLGIRLSKKTYDINKRMKINCQENTIVLLELGLSGKSLIWDLDIDKGVEI